MTEQEEKILASLTSSVIQSDLEKERDKCRYWFRRLNDKYYSRSGLLNCLYREVQNHDLTSACTKPFTYQGEHFMWTEFICLHKGRNGVVKRKDGVFYVYGDGNDRGLIMMSSLNPDETEFDKMAYVFYTSELFCRLEDLGYFEDENDRLSHINSFVEHNPVIEYSVVLVNGKTNEIIVVLDKLILAGRMYEDDSRKFVLTHCTFRTCGNMEWCNFFADAFEFPSHTDAVEHCRKFEENYEQNYNAFFSFDENIEKKVSEVTENAKENVGKEYSSDIHFSLARGGAYYTPIETGHVEPENKEIYRYKDMDKKMKEQLRRILKSYGLRDKYENLIKDIHTTVDAWYEWVESVYAISRLHPYIKNEKDRPKFLQADKEWVAYVVSEDKCAVLDEYVQRHTKSVVVQAIHYLMDNSLWEAPLGKENIRKANADIYKGMKAIDEAVEYLRSENLLQVEEQKEETTVEQEHIIEFDDDDSVTGKRTEAQRAFSYCHATFKELSERFGVLAQYFEQDELTDLLEKENTKLTKENDRLTESIKVVNQQLGEARKETERQKQLAFDATKERNTAIDNFNKLKAQYDMMKQDYDYLKREAQKTQELPKAKIIPLSKLRDLPLVGPTVLKSLIPFLKANNIVVDDRK